MKVIKPHWAWTSGMSQKLIPVVSSRQDFVNFIKGYPPQYARIFVHIDNPTKLRGCKFEMAVVIESFKMGLQEDIQKIEKYIETYQEPEGE